MAGLIFFILYIPFYFTKGIILKRNGLQAVMTITVLILGYLLWTVALSFSGWVEMGFKLFLILELLLYALRLFGITAPLPVFFSRFSFEQDEVRIQYTLFKPLFLLIADVVLLIKRLPVIHLDDVVEIDVKVNDKQMVLIKL
ncbi:MAG TPA: hypothetical protein ENN72_00670 [Firmicutes bacterium]|nr:hypothetical protein [Bacillota bacterium]